jgi:predicted dehydrogenase
MARGFATDLPAVEGAELAAVASRAPQSIDNYWRRFPGARLDCKFDDVLADTSIDVVYIATPNHVHVDHAIRSLEAGKAVLCEKPFTLNAVEARSVSEVARSRQIFCMEAMWMRFVPAFRRAVQLVLDGAIGEPRLLYADFGVPAPVDPRSRLFDPAQGGGALLDRGVYCVSLATKLFGRPVDVVASAAPTSSGVDEHVATTLRFTGGELAILSASLSSQSGNAALVTGTRGSIAIEAPFVRADRLTLRRYVPPPASGTSRSRRAELMAVARRSAVGRAAIRLVRPAVTARSTQRFRLPISGSGYGYEAAEVVRCLDQGELESPGMTLDESILVMETLDAVRAAALQSA